MLRVRAETRPQYVEHLACPTCGRGTNSRWRQERRSGEYRETEDREACTVARPQQRRIRATGAARELLDGWRRGGGGRRLGRLECWERERKDSADCGCGGLKL